MGRIDYRDEEGYMSQFKNLPSMTTLRKYGLGAMEYAEIWNRQGGRCPICKREFDNKVRPVIDHKHIPNYKRKSPEIRRRYVRGLVCAYCNFRVLPKSITLDKARNIVHYLTLFDLKLRELGI